MKQIDSQAIDWVDFTLNPKDNTRTVGVMQVHFRGRKWVYYYEDVPLKLYKEFCGLTEGHGAFFRDNIRDKFKETKEDA